MFYLLFIHFSLGRRSLLILWNMPKLDHIVSAFYPRLPGEDFSSYLVEYAEKIRMKNWIILYRFLSTSPWGDFSSHLVEYAEKNQNVKFPFNKNWIMLYRFFIHFSPGRRSLLILPGICQKMRMNTVHWTGHFNKNWIILYRLFIHFSPGRRSLLILPD